MPIRIKTTPVMLLAQRSIFLRLSKAFPTNRAPKAVRIAKTTTGSAVPIPYSAGNTTLDWCCTARGIKEPKKRAAEIGQKESAKVIPRRPAPRIKF